MNCTSPCRAEAHMKATELLVHEHKYILRVLNILEGMAEKVERGRPLDQADVEDLLRFLRIFADKQHQAKEESVLFPALLRACHQDQMSALRHMTFEHDQERSLVEGLEDALLTKKGKDFVYYVNRLNHVLRTHIYKEEHILFKIADANFSSGEDEKVVSELAKFDQYPDEVLHSLQERLTALEWKYLSRTDLATGR